MDGIDNEDSKRKRRTTIAEIAKESKVNGDSERELARPNERDMGDKNWEMDVVQVPSLLDYKSWRKYQNIFPTSLSEGLVNQGPTRTRKPFNHASRASETRGTGKK
jgi:hypothetical protein